MIDLYLARFNETRAYLDAGYSVAAINYRLTDMASAPAAYRDCARALQFLRHHAQQYNLNPRLVASTGGSAGAGTSMWIAFHDDLADPDSDNPIARQSTRLTCVAVSNGQSSYDSRFAEKSDRGTSARSARQGPVAIPTCVSLRCAESGLSPLDLVGWHPVVR